MVRPDRSTKPQAARQPPPAPPPPPPPPQEEHAEATPHAEGSLGSMLPEEVCEWLYGGQGLTWETLADALLSLDPEACEATVRLIQLYQMQAGGSVPRVQPSQPRR